MIALSDLVFHQLHPMFSLLVRSFPKIFRKSQESLIVSGEVGGLQV